MISRLAQAPDRVLHKLTFQIDAGECLIVSGASGSGKSTLARLLTRFYDPSSGSVLIDSIPIENIDLVFLRSIIGCVTQDGNLFTGTLRANILYGSTDASKADIDKAIRLCQLTNVVDSLGLDTPIGSQEAILSRGERQRVLLARAIIPRPRLLILDEATSAIGGSLEKLILNGLRQEMQNTAFIIMTHRPADVPKFNGHTRYLEMDAQHTMCDLLPSSTV